MIKPTILSNFTDFPYELKIMESCHIFAITDPFFHKLWSWDQLIEILPKLKNVKAKWFAIETIGEVCSLGEESKSRLFEEVSMFVWL